MSVAPWLLPVLWREHDWRGALDRLRTELAEIDAPPEKITRAAVDLARATEYIEPDRRKAIAILELAGIDGDLTRARELALELGWWPAYARLALLACTLEFDPKLIVDEAEAWWDAGQPDMCALALSGLRVNERSQAAIELSALCSHRDLRTNATAAIARARSTTGIESADAHVMAARFASVASRPTAVIEHLEAALAAAPGHGKAATLLLSLASQQPEPDAIHRFLRARLAGADPTIEVDRMRACACALLDTEHQRGYALRLLRRALERAYEAKLPHIPGHLAMWTILAANASADGTRRDLLGLVLDALQSVQTPYDRVWLGALATEITLRDAKNLAVAGAYAEIVAEHAPEHPIVRELVTAIAASEPAPAVPPAAIAAAAAQVDDSVDIDVDLDETYAVATGASLEAPAPEPPARTPGRRASTSMPPLDKPIPAPAPAPAPTPAPAPYVPPAKKRTITIPAIKSIAPASVAKPAPAPKPAPVTPVTVPNPSTIVPPARKSAVMPAISPLPPKPRTDPAPVLDALRTPDRPAMPPKPPDPPDAAPRARRISIPIDVRIATSDGKRLAGHSRDISTTGLFVLVTGELAIGSEHGIELMLPGSEPFTEDEYRARARVVRKADGGYGVELVTPDPKLLAALAAL